MADAFPWLTKLSHLRVDRARGPAPHKPLLLLVVCDLAQEGLLSNPLAISPEIASRFLSYWPIVAHRRPQRPDIRLPFFHLSSDGIWTALDGEGCPTTNRDRVQFAQIAPDFLEILAEPRSRDRARHALIAAYFLPSEQIALCEAVGLALPGDVRLEENATFKTALEARQAGRDARFRTSVIAAYNYTCALTGYRLVTIAGASIVDAAHIHEFKDSRNNDVQNGLALCKNAHWLFDTGLWTISDDLRVLVASGHFCESAEYENSLLQRMAGRRIRLPRTESLWPSRRNIAWHRENKFLCR